MRQPMPPMRPMRPARFTRPVGSRRPVRSTGAAGVVARVTVLTVAAAIGLTGCGRADGGGGAAAKPAATVSAGPATGTITVWAMGTEGEKLPTLVKRFEQENPQADVQVTPVPWDAAHDKIANAIAGRKTPDVSMIGTTWMGEFAKAGALDPTPPGVVDPKAFFPGAWQTTMLDGTSYAVPWYVETRALFYRKDFADKAGVAGPPRNWDELKAMARALKDKGGAKWGIFLQPGQTGSWQTMLPFAWQAGARLSDGKGKVTIDSPAMVEALRYYQSFFTENLAPKDNLAGQPGAIEQGFAKGDLGMFVSGPWHMTLVEEQGGKGFADKYAVAPMPTNRTGDSFIGGSDLAVFKSAKNRDAAWKFVRFLMRPDIQREWYKTSSDLPAVQSAWSGAPLAGDPKLAVFGEQLKRTQTPPTFPTWEQIAAEIDREVERVATAGADPAQAARSMQSKATSIGTGG
jgi:multiple sugar transport system substrate-binding protein